MRFGRFNDFDSIMVLGNRLFVTSEADIQSGAAGGEGSGGGSPAVNVNTYSQDLPTTPPPAPRPISKHSSLLNSVRASANAETVGAQTIVNNPGGAQPNASAQQSTSLEPPPDQNSQRPNAKAITPPVPRPEAPKAAQQNQPVTPNNQTKVDEQPVVPPVQVTPPAPAETGLESVDNLYKNYGGKVKTDFTLDTFGKFVAGKHNGKETIEKLSAKDIDLTAQLGYAFLEKFGSNDNVLKHLIATNPDAVEKILIQVGIDPTTVQVRKDQAPNTQQQPQAQRSSAPVAQRFNDNPDVIARVLEKHGIEADSGAAKLITDLIGQHNSTADQVNALKSELDKLTEWRDTSAEKDRDSYWNGVKTEADNRLDNEITGLLKNSAQFGPEQDKLVAKIVRDVSISIGEDPAALSLYKKYISAKGNGSHIKAEDHFDSLNQLLLGYVNDAVNILAPSFVKSSQQLAQVVTQQRNIVNPTANGVAANGGNNNNAQPKVYTSLLQKMKDNPV